MAPPRQGHSARDQRKPDGVRREGYASVISMKSQVVLGLLLMVTGCALAEPASQTNVRGQPEQGSAAPAPADAPPAAELPRPSSGGVEVPIGHLPGYEEEKARANER